MKVKLTYVAIAIAIIVAGLIGWKIRGPQPTRITDTLTVFKHDTVSMVIVKKGRTIVKLDTILWEDTTKLNGYIELYEALIGQQTTTGSPDGQEAVEKPATGLPVASKSYLRASPDLQMTIEGTPDIIPGVGLLILDHLTASYHYNINAKKHIAGIGWTF